MEVTIIKKHPIPKKTAVIIVLISMIKYNDNKLRDLGIERFRNYSIP